MEKNIVKITETKNFDILLPDWFIRDRGDLGVTFKEQKEKNGFLELPRVYKKLFEFLVDKNHLVFVDVGANLGFTSLPIAINGNKVISIEPLESNYKLLKNSKNLNNLNFDLLKIAIGEFEGLTKIYSGEQTDCASVILESVKLVENNFQFEEEIEIKRLDNIIKDDNLFVKIDVQGFEMNVLKSMEKLFNENKVKFILIEMENRFLIKGGSSENEVHNFLINKGFIKNNFFGDDVLYIKNEN